MATAQLETDEQVGLAPASPAAPAAPAPETDQAVGLTPQAEPQLESDSDVGLTPPPPQRDQELEQALLQRAKTISPLGMAATGLEAARRVMEAKLGVATPERGRTVPEIQRALLREPQPSFVGELTQPIVHYQPFKINKDDHWALAAGKEAVNVAISIPEFFTSPLGVITPGIAAEAPATTAAAFTADMLYNLGRGIVSTVKGWTGMSPGQKAASIVDLGANGVLALALGHSAKKAGEQWLYKPAAGRTLPPEVQAWAATFGVGEGEAETGIRAPAARVLATQPYVPPEPGPMQPIPRPEEEFFLSRDEANMQGPQAVDYIMAKFGVDRDTAVSIQQSNRSRLGITATPAQVTTPIERTTDVTPTGVRIERVGEETQLPRVREGQDLRTYPAEVRQAPSGQAAGGGGPVPAAEVQAAPPAPDVRSIEEVFQGTPEVPTGQTRVRVRTPAGDVVPGVFNGYWGPGQPSIAFVRPSGAQSIPMWSHGMLPPGYTVLDPIPAFEDWQARQASAAAPAAPAGVSVPLMITREMEQSLADLGYTQAQRNTLTPQQAQDIIASQRRAPTAAAPPAAAAAPAPAPAPIPPITTEMVERGRSLIDQAMTLVRTRQLTDQDRMALAGEMENIRRGDLSGMQAQLDRLQNAPIKQPKVGRAFTAIDRFHRESERVRAQIGEEDILDWINRTGGMLSKNGAIKLWGKKRYQENKSLWDDAPDDLPIHHEMAIYSGRRGPDVVATRAFEEHKISEPSINALWPAIDRASKTRRGALGETEREAQIQAEDERQFLEWKDRTKTAEPGKEVPVTAESLGVDDLLEVDGQRIRVTEVDPDTGDVTLEDGQKFGVRKVREGDAVFYVQRHEPAPTVELPAEEPPAAPARPELPKVPGPLPKGIPKADIEEAFRQQRERWDKYNADVAAWEAAQPQNKPIIFRRENGSHAAITPDPQGGWRVTTFTKLYADSDKLAPWGHERYNTRLEAVQGMLSSGRDGEIVEHLPEVMTEEEIRQENERRNAPAAPAAPAAPPPTLRPGEAAGELFQGADQPFNLAGQAGVDAERIAAERAAAEARTKEAADIAARQQPELPATPPKAPEAPKAPETPKPAKPAKFGGTTAAGTVVDNYVKGDNGRWYQIDEQGNRKKDRGGKELPPVNDKKHQDLERRAGLPAPPPETRTPIEILSQANQVRVKLPEGATMVRVTDTQGRKSDVFVADANRGDNIFRGVPIAKIEAGFINSKKQFQKVKGDVTVEDVGKTVHSLAPEWKQGPAVYRDRKGNVTAYRWEHSSGDVEVWPTGEDPHMGAAHDYKRINWFVWLPKTGERFGPVKRTKAEAIASAEQYIRQQREAAAPEDFYERRKREKEEVRQANVQTITDSLRGVRSREEQRLQKLDAKGGYDADVAANWRKLPQALKDKIYDFVEYRALQENRFEGGLQYGRGSGTTSGADAVKAAISRKQNALDKEVDAIVPGFGSTATTFAEGAGRFGEDVTTHMLEREPSLEQQHDIEGIQGTHIANRDYWWLKFGGEDGYNRFIAHWQKHSPDAYLELTERSGMSPMSAAEEIAQSWADTEVANAKRTGRSLATEQPRAPLAVNQVESHIAQQFGVQPGGIIEVINDPAEEWNGESSLAVQPGSGRGPSGKFIQNLTKIRVNAAKLSSAADVQAVVEHELAHGAAERVGIVIKGITDKELEAIYSEIRQYPEAERHEEVKARLITTLADSWKTRNWFQKAVGTVLAWAHEIGVPLTRLSAERIAAQAIAEQLTLIRRGSVINQPAVERVVHSLPLNPRDWEMKEFFNTIGLQAATIGGYLHRYVRQVAKADELSVSDRARALDGMNQARELTELAQGMGGRANYYDAIANATTLGERNEVLRSAFESVVRYQQLGVDLRRKVAEKLSVLQSESFRNKLLQAARKRDRAELAEEVRRTYTLQIAAAAGRITQTLNDLRTVGAMHEQLQGDLTRLQAMPQFDNAVAQHFNTIVDRLAQTERGLSLLMGGGDRTGQDIWDEYMRLRFADGQGIPQGNEFALGQLASAVLAANRDLRNQFASLALLARDIVTTQEWNRAASMIAQSIQNDPQAAIPRILQRAGNLGERSGRAEAAWLALNRGIERTLRDYSQHEEAVNLHNAVETDPEYRQWVNDVLNNPAVQGLQIPEEIRGRMEEAGRREPFFKYSGQDTVYSPQGKAYRINLQFTPQNVQATMADLIRLNADITDWLDQPQNQNDPSRLFWQERQRLYEGTLMSSAIWHPNAIESLVTESSFGMAESFYQGLALPAAKLAFLADKAFDRYWTQGKGWYNNNVDLSERAIQLAYKEHGFNELNRKAYQRAVLNALGWEFRNGREVRVGDVINALKVTAQDLALLHAEGRMTNDLFDRMWNTAKASGAEGVMELPRVIDEFTGSAWGLRRPMEIGIHKNTTLPHNFSSHGEALANQVHALIEARNNELTKLPQRVVDEAMTPDQRNAAHADIINRFNESLALTLNDPDIFQNAVLGFMRQRAENWVRLDGLSPFEEHYREITRMVSAEDPAAPKTVEDVLDYLNQHVPVDMTPDQVRKQFFGEWEKLTERFYKMHSERDTGVKVTTDKRTTAFTQGFQQDLGPAYFYDYGWMDAGEMRRYSTDMAEFGFERMQESRRALHQNMTEAIAELSAAAEERKPEIIRRTMAEYREGRDFRNLQTLQNKRLELERQIAGGQRWMGNSAVHAEGISLRGASRFVSFMIASALTGPRTAARISGISMGGSAWKMGIVFSQLGYGRLRSFPAAAASAITSAFRVGTATGLGWFHPGKGFVPGVPLRILLNIPGAAKAALAKEGSERIYSAIESVLKGTTDEQFAALGWWFDQKALGMTPDTAIGARIANILSASRTKGGVLSRPGKIPTTAVGGVLRGAKLVVSKPWALGEAFVAGTNVYLPGAFGYNITYDAVGRQAGWYIDMLAANARRTFDTYERLGQLGRFNFDSLTDPRNKLMPWEVLPSFAGRFRFVDPARLPAWARPNSTNLQFARELFSTSTDIDLQDLLINYWKRLSQTAPEARGAVEFLAPEETDAARATERAEARARGIISRFVEQTHHAAPSNRPYWLQKTTGFQAILPFMGWSVQTLKLIDTTLGKVAFSSEARGVQADTYAGLMIAAGLTALGVSAYAFVGGDLEARLIRQLDRLFHHKEGTVKTIDEARDMKEAAEITLHNMTAGIPMLNSTLNQILGMTGYRGGNVGFQAFAFDKVNSMLTYTRDVYRTHDLTHGLDRLAEANIPISETIIENTFQREGLQNNRNAVRVLQKFGPQDLVERRASLSIALPTEMTPYRQALVEAVGSGNQELVAETYQAFIEKATELGRTDPDKLARQMFSTLNPYRQAFGGVLTDQQRADTLAKMSPVQRQMVETMERNYGLAAATLGLTAEFEKQEKAPPLQRVGSAAGGGGAVSLPTGRAAAGGGGLSRIGTGLRRISLSGPRPPRIRLPGMAAPRGGTGAKRLTTGRTRYVKGRLSSRSPRARRLTARRPSRRRISLLA